MVGLPTEMLETFLAINNHDDTQDELLLGKSGLEHEKRVINSTSLRSATKAYFNMIRQLEQKIKEPA
jgi:hypothetical protein